MLLKYSKTFIKYLLVLVLLICLMACSKKEKLTEIISSDISNVQATNVTVSEVAITWTTNEPTTSQVIYGKTTSYGLQTAEDTNKTTSHTVTLSGLDLNTLYHYKVMGTNAAGNTVASGDYSFSTAAGDTTPPIIANIVISNVSVAGAKITWTTDEPATSQVFYGKTASYGSQTAEDTSKTTSHSVTLNSLAAGSVYYYKVKSTDVANNSAISGDNSFTVLVISNVSAGNLTATSAVIAWTTVESSTSQVYYGTSTVYDAQTVEDNKLVTSHSVTLTGLHAGTVYHYAVKSAGAANSSTFGSDATLTTDTKVYLYFDDIEYTDDTNTVKIYDDDLLIGIASGYMGSSSGISFTQNRTYPTNPHSGTNCFRIVYDTSLETWMGLYVLAGGNWTATTTALSGLNTATSKLTFYARADSEIKVKELGMGVNGSDVSGQNRLTYQTLNSTWQKFIVDLAGKNISNQIGLFYFTIDKP